MKSIYSEENREILSEITESSTGNCGINTYEIVEGYVSHNDYEHIYQEGGGEGGAEYCESVFKWKGKYYKITYNYYSYTGYRFDSAEMGEVFPTEKTITVYE
jgi:hypothetical protein